MSQSKLNTIYQNFVTNGLDPQQTDQITQQRIKTLNLVGLTLTFIALFWTVVDAVLFDRMVFSIIEGVATIIGFLFLVVYRFSKNTQLMTNIAFFIVTTVIVVTLLPLGLDSIETLWVYLLPPFAFFLLGIQGGVIWTITIFLAMLMLLAGARLGYLQHEIRDTFIINLFSSYFIVALFSYQYEQARLQALDKLSRKNSELQRLVYTVSHDLKTPIVSLLGYLSFVREEIDSGEEKQRDEDLDKMNQICNNMRQMINDLLNLSRVKRQGQFSNVSTGDVVVNILTENESQLRSAGIETEMHGQFPTVITEERKFQEVMRNLISNAIKYMGNASKPLIEIGVTDHEDNFEFYVKDSGIGIDKEELSKVFEPFYAKSDISIGSGIGLSIAKGFVDDLGGKIWADSQKGSGSTFHFTIPKDPPITEDDDK
ncbi:HAMP domain-containing histidine kinase [candidate division WWE3 bacterium]|uniref:histidine kinase n=1 Tax=candidate division WWE3 bacterium TaxID=2053526 RepID=A0A955LFL1_UNCKA|nr:HAMP domain-containing histidine kinase [candidate division WWE3 bacterium]